MSPHLWVKGVRCRVRADQIVGFEVVSQEATDESPRLHLLYAETTGGRRYLLGGFEPADPAPNSLVESLPEMLFHSASRGDAGVITIGDGGNAKVVPFPLRKEPPSLRP